MFAKRFLLKNRELIAPQIDVILWFYGARQEDVFRELQQALHQQHIEFVLGLPQNSRGPQDASSH